MKLIIISLALCACAISCSTKKDIPENLVVIKEAVAQLDSAVASMYGWEPQDSTYNSDITSSAIEQKTYDDARVTWAEFKRLCDAGKFEDALVFYEGDNSDTNRKNAGDFLVFLKHSTQRYCFYSQILRPLMQEYQGEDEALDKYISLLQLEKAMEDFSIEMQADGNGYIPEVYPYVVRDLGLGLTATGKIDEALEYADNLAYAVFGLTGDSLFSDFLSTQYVAQLYTLDGQFDQAIDTWEGYKGFLKGNAADYDTEELGSCLTQIDAEIAKLQ